MGWGEVGLGWVGWGRVGRVDRGGGVWRVPL